MAELTINEFMAGMAKSFVAEKAAGVDAVIQFKFSGTEAGEWNVTIKEGKCLVAQGLAPSPKLTLSADSKDFIKVFTGQLDGMQAFMQGKLRLQGDMSLAMKLMSLFKTN
jgi:putative sterol carrier protein